MSAMLPDEGTRNIMRNSQFNIPNALTALRLVLVPVFVWLFLSGLWALSLTVYVTACITDWLDGYLARKWNQITDFGKLADPVADKLMTIVVLACLAHRDVLPWWVLCVVLLKELLMITGGAFLFRRRNIVVMANRIGKAATVMVFAALATLLLTPTLPQVEMVGMVLLYAALATSLVALGVYFAGIFMRAVKDKESKPSR